MTVLALTAYPLSTGFRERFEAEIGVTPSYLNIAQLRRLPPAELLRRLRPRGATACFIPLEDEGSRAILPMLQAVAALTTAREIQLVGPDLSRTRVSRWRAAPSLARLLHASADGQMALRACSRELAVLLRKRRVPVPFADERILYVNPNLWFGLKAGGSVGHVAGVVNALAATGRRVGLAAVSESTLVRPEVTGHLLDVPRSFGMPVEVNYYRFQRSMVEQLSGIARGAGSQLLYQRMSVASYAGPVLSRRLELPLVVEYNGSEVWAAKHWGRELRYSELAQQAEDACLRHAHLVVTISSVLHDELRGRGVEEERIVCYPNCVDPVAYDAGRFPPAERAELRRRLGIAEDAVVATFVGTFGQWHGVDVLARVIAALVRTDADWLRRRRVHFLLVGDGLKMTEVRELIGDARHREFVTLAGLVPQQDAPAFLAASDVLLAPHVANQDGTPFFGSPTKLFEYMAMGKAIVASDLDQIGDVLRESLRHAELPAPAAMGKRLAVLVPPGDEDALRDGIRFLVDHPEWRDRLGEAARAEVLERYTWSHHVDAILYGLRRVGGRG